MHARRAAVILGALAIACGGSATPAPAPQVVLVIDTDAHVSGELDSRDDLSPDATVDTLRVDVLEAGGATNTFVVDDPAGWPVSFGVVGGASPTVSLRLRLFRALFADRGTLNGVDVLDPPSQVTIDRIVSLAMPPAGVTRFEVTLTEDCLGTPPSFLAPRTTCVDAATPAGDPTQGLTALPSQTPPSQVGSWAPGVDVPCQSPATGDRVCIPGGFDIMGDSMTVGILPPLFDSLPYLATVVSPFAIDVHEMTVGRFRGLVNSGKYKGAMPVTQNDPNSAEYIFCTWLGTADATDDKLPLNCIDYDAAKAVCAAVGGALPTEAQWNHAARGRGERRLFPWGSDPPTCCSESVAQLGALTCTPGNGPQPVGSHLPSSACGGIGDVTRDGVVDMGGSMSEALLDDLEAYDGAYWSAPGIFVDPSCKSPNPVASAARGGNWEVGFGLSATPFRSEYLTHPAFGLRCAYAVGP
jgi:formylglycine-generating enzyme required for sulfatase activity